ncbi:hypothetical protein C8Q77DRAFT_776502 [Trametes polyzona]|nr:hypothetical protein C8Q77DRAFT_776502 [Trametes polyzona]
MLCDPCEVPWMPCNIATKARPHYRSTCNCTLSAAILATDPAAHACLDWLQVRSTPSYTCAPGQPNSTPRCYDMETLPLETAQMICELACTDGGYTGQSLALVSKAYRAISRRTRFHSLMLAASPRRQCAASNPSSPCTSAIARPPAETSLGSAISMSRFPASKRCRRYQRRWSRMRRAG